VSVLCTPHGWLPVVQVIKRWRVWAPVKHAQRRHLRDAVMTLHSNTRRRVWNCMREYTAKRRIVRAAKQRAFQHFRYVAMLYRSAAAAVCKAGVTLCHQDFDHVGANCLCYSPVATTMFWVW
jgi:hypothetical protein